MAVQSSTSFVIADRTIALPLNIDTFGVVGDANSKVVEFRTDRYADGADLSTKQIFVCYKNALTETGETECVDIKFTATTLTFNWVVPPEVVTTTGNIEFYVEFRETVGESSVYKLKTKSITQFVEDSFYIYNNVTAPDTSVLDSWLAENPEHIDRADLIDSDLPFKVDDRNILFNPSKIVAVRDDSLSQALTFRMKRVVDNVDRADSTFGFAFKNSKGETGLMPACNIMATEDEVFISWALEGIVTKVVGKVEFFIIVINTLDDGKRYVWNTKTASFNVENTFDVENGLEVPSEHWYETFMLEVENAVNQASIHANEVKGVYSQAVAVSASIDTILESCKEAELGAQKFAAEAKEAFASLKDVTITRSNKVENGIFEIVTYKRKDGTMYAQTSLTKAGNNDKYTGLLVQMYALDGTTLISEETIPIAYDDEGHITGYLGILNYLSYHTDVFSKVEKNDLEELKVKTGTVITHMGVNAPNGYLICDGTEYVILEYPHLAQHFKDEFGTVNHFGGNGTTTFAVPTVAETITDMIRCIKY